MLFESVKQREQRQRVVGVSGLCRYRRTAENVGRIAVFRNADVYGGKRFAFCFLNVVFKIYGQIAVPFVIAESTACSRRCERYAIFSIDRGSEAGIAAGDTVVSGDGLAGFVTEVGEGWSKVRPAISADETLSFRLARDSGQLGIVSGDSEGLFSGYMLDEESTVVEGDVIISSGMGACPAGIEIGTVRSVSYNSNRLIREITVEPAVDFKSLRKVAVIV